MTFRDSDELSPLSTMVTSVGRSIIVGVDINPDAIGGGGPAIRKGRGREGTAGRA